MLKAIVFDFDGVIVDSEPLHCQALQRVAEGLGVRFTYQDYLEKYIGFDDRDAFRAILGLPTGLAGSSSQETRVADLIQQKARAFEAVVNQGIQTIPGIEPLIRAAAAVMPIAIASGASQRDIDLVLNRLGFQDLFSVVISADMVARSKPHPQIFILAAAQLAQNHPALRLQPAECLAIEDTAAGIESACSAGLLTLALLTSTAPEKLHRAHRVMPTVGAPTLAQLQAWFA